MHSEKPRFPQWNMNGDKVSDPTTIAPPATPAGSPRATGGRAEILLTWTLTGSAAFAGSAGGAVLLLLAKPIGGILGVPGAVIGYITVTAAALGSLTALLAPRLLRVPAAAAWCAVLASACLVVASITTAPIPFCCAILTAGAATGLVHATARLRAADRPSTIVRHALSWLGLLAGAAVARLTHVDPTDGLLAAGLATAVLAVIALPAAIGAPTVSPSAPGTWGRTDLLGAATLGAALGAAFAGAPHLLLFRWELTDLARIPIIALAGAAALLAVLVPGRPRDPAPFAILAAGGLLLVAVAPAAWAIGVGVAVTSAACARAAARPDRDGAPTALLCAAGLGAVAGLGLVEALGAVLGAGTALTLAAGALLLLVAATVLTAPRPRTPVGVRP